jgi:hypothetical protein
MTLNHDFCFDLIKMHLPNSLKLSYEIIIRLDLDLFLSVGNFITFQRSSFGGSFSKASLFRVLMLVTVASKTGKFHKAYHWEKTYLTDVFLRCFITNLIQA